MILVGIDIGGTKISVTLGDEKGTIFFSKKMATQSFEDGNDALSGIMDIIKKMLQSASYQIDDITAIGISSPGPVDTKKGMMLTPPNLPLWHHTQLVDPFKQVFQKPTFMNNDANAAALAEHHFGHLKGTQDLIYLTASTGMGGGIIVNHQLLQGITDTAGEVGHMVLDINGPPCPCSMRGCFEVYCGGGNVAKRVQQEIKEKRIETEIISLAGEHPIDMAVIVEAVKKEDSYALSIWDGFIERLAQGISILLMAFNPQAIVLGTIAIHAGELLLKPLQEKLKEFTWKEPLGACRIEASSLGEKNHQLSPLAVAIYGLQGDANNM